VKKKDTNLFASSRGAKRKGSGKDRDGAFGVRGRSTVRRQLRATNASALNVNIHIDLRSISCA